MKTKGKYLYCIIKEKKPKQFNVLGIEGGKVYTISEGELSAVVSDAKIKEYPIFRENTLTHQKVIEEIMKEYDVLPFAFGIVAPSASGLKKRLASESEGLEEEFEKIKGKIELNLKALWLDMPTIFQEIVSSSQKIQRAKREQPIRGDLIEIGKLVSQLLEEKKEREAQKILKPLKEIGADFKENEVFGDDMILNAAFLVERSKEKDFDKAVSALKKEDEKRIKFFYVGPIPPFNFVKLILHV